MTEFHYKPLLTVPASLCAEINAWVRETIDPTGTDWLTPGLSADGKEPFTHAQCCFHATAGQGEAWAKMLDKWVPLLDLEGFTEDTEGELRARLAAYQPALKLSKGVGMSMAFNEQKKEPDMAEILVEMGVKRAGGEFGEAAIAGSGQ